MSIPQAGLSIFSRIFNELPVPAVIFFKKSKNQKPLANVWARKLFGVQLSPLRKNLLFYAVGGKLRRYPAQELPWNIALEKGIGAQKDDLVMQGGKKPEVLLQAFSMPIREGKELSAAVVTFEDVTLRRKLEEDLYIRTVKLEIANEHLKDLDRAKTEFVSLASHQLKTPLTAIRWFMELVREGDAGPINAKQKEYLQDANKAVLRLVELMNFLLNVSRIETGKLSVRPQKTDSVEFTKSVIRESEALFNARAQTCSFSVDVRLPAIALDEKIIREVLLNLLSNAAKYTPAGGNVWVRIFRKGAFAVWEVRDSGYGIPEREKIRMFEKFFRASNVLKYDTEGTGLGLYLARSLVELCGGTLWFTSKEHVGSSFFFTIPLEGTKPYHGEKQLSEYPKLIPTFHKPR